MTQVTPGGRRPWGGEEGRPVRRAWGWSSRDSAWWLEEQEGGITWLRGAPRARGDLGVQEKQLEEHVPARGKELELCSQSNGEPLDWPERGGTIQVTM